MNVIVVIEGREAIPVRAIPLLTDWGRMSPDEIAAVMAGGAASWPFNGLTAYSNEDGKIRSIAHSLWENNICRKLNAISDRTEHTQISSETGYQDWRRESLGALPSGAFVWKDEYEPKYQRAFGPENTTFTSDSGAAMSEADQVKHVALQFDPFISEPEIRRLVMEGFDPAAMLVVNESESHGELSPPAQPLPRFAAQEAAILDKLRSLGFDPLQLPKNPSGKSGVKAQIKGELGNKGIWAGTTVFDRAWERLRKNGDIAN